MAIFGKKVDIYSIVFSVNGFLWYTRKWPAYGLALSKTPGFGWHERALFLAPK